MRAHVYSSTLTDACDAHTVMPIKPKEEERKDQGAQRFSEGSQQAVGSELPLLRCSSSTSEEAGPDRMRL